MKSAVIILEEKKALKKALLPVLDRRVIDLVVHELYEAGAHDVYVVGDKDLDIKAKVTKDLYGAIELIGLDSELIVIDDVYPFLDEGDYKKLYAHDRARIKGTKIIKIDTKELTELKSLELDTVEVEEDRLADILDPKVYRRYRDDLKERILDYHEANGVILLDRDRTFIGPDARIEDGVIIEGDTHIYGDTLILKGTKITSGSYIEDSEIGNDDVIISSRIIDSKVHDRNTIGPYAHLRMHTEVFNDTRIGNFVEFKNTRFDDGSRCAHLTYLGDCTVGKDVNIGCGVVTVNYDGKHKNHTYIADHAFIGSNANLVAPITIGEYALVAAGSTVTKDVPDKDMAIARPFETYKKGYGYTYIKKEK